MTHGQRNWRSRANGWLIAIACALLAALLPVERLVGPDIEAGVIDQMVVRGVPLPVIGFARTIGHWLGFAPPLMLAESPFTDWTHRTRQFPAVAL